MKKLEIIRSQEFMLSEMRLKFLKKIIIILGPKTAILGPQFCRILVPGPLFRWSGGPLDPPLKEIVLRTLLTKSKISNDTCIVHNSPQPKNKAQCKE